MNPASRYDAILIVGFGGPTGPEEVRPFLDNVLRGRPVPKERYEEVVRHYEHIGGRSPYNEVATRISHGLKAELARAGVSIPVFLAMRNWKPYLADAIAEMASRGVRRALGFVLAAHRSDASWDRYIQAVSEARARAGASAPEVDYVSAWHDHPLFIEAAASAARDALKRLGSDQHEAQVVFTAHSIPVAMAAASPYVEQITESSRLVAGALGIKSWTLVFQSRSGSPREPWLEPDIGDALRKLAGKPVVVVPIGFVVDNVEVAYDLDVAAAAVARGAGVRMERAATVGEHPLFIKMMAAVVRAHLGAPRE
ncbi:MAG: ferrochelatase [Candidatus Binataceae bacterium]